MVKGLMATNRPFIFFSTSRTNLLHLFRSQKKQFVRGAMFLSATDKKSVSFIYREVVPLTYGDGASRISRSFGFSGMGSRKFNTGATGVNEAGSFDQPLMQSMEKKIKEQLNAESVSVKDMSGDGRHVCINVVSSAFEGQSSVNRQRMVYKAIWEELQNAVHAVDQMSTKTPTEVEAQK